MAEATNSPESDPQRWMAVFASLHSPNARMLNVDLLAVLLAASLPWSTTAVGILIALWLLAVAPTLDARVFFRSLARPACLMPLVFFVLAVLGTSWADSPWPARLHGISPVAKLLAIPFLLHHFERSERGNWVFVGFFVSCSLLMALSWIVYFAPEFKLTVTASDGVPVKNYIDQSQEFVLCMLGLGPFMMSLYNKQRHALAAVCAALMLGFFSNMAFVVSARSALVYTPVLLLVFAFRHLSRRASVLMLGSILMIATIVWFASPYLRGRIADVAKDYQNYQQNIPRSTGQRLEYWQKSLRFFVEAPLFGHGT